MEEISKVKKAIDGHGRLADIHSHDFIKTMVVVRAQKDSFLEVIEDSDMSKNVLKDFRRSSSWDYVTLLSPHLLQNSLKHRTWITLMSQ